MASDVESLRAALIWGLDSKFGKSNDKKNKNKGEDGGSRGKKKKKNKKSKDRGDEENPDKDNVDEDMVEEDDESRVQNTKNKKNKKKKRKRADSDEDLVRVKLEIEQLSSQDDNDDNVDTSQTKNKNKNKKRKRSEVMEESEMEVVSSPKKKKKKKNKHRDEEESEVTAAEEVVSEATKKKKNKKSRRSEDESAVEPAELVQKKKKKKKKKKGAFGPRGDDEAEAGGSQDLFADVERYHSLPSATSASEDEAQEESNEGEGVSGPPQPAPDIASRPLQPRVESTFALTEIQFRALNENGSSTTTSRSGSSNFGNPSLGNSNLGNRSPSLSNSEPVSRDGAGESGLEEEERAEKSPDVPAGSDKSPSSPEDSDRPPSSLAASDKSPDVPADSDKSSGSSEVSDKSAEVEERPDKSPSILNMQKEGAETQGDEDSDSSEVVTQLPEDEVLPDNEEAVPDDNEALPAVASNPVTIEEFAEPGSAVTIEEFAEPESVATGSNSVSGSAVTGSKAPSPRRSPRQAPEDAGKSVSTGNHAVIVGNDSTADGNDSVLAGNEGLQDPPSTLRRSPRKATTSPAYFARKSLPPSPERDHEDENVERPQVFVNPSFTEPAQPRRSPRKKTQSLVRDGEHSSSEPSPVRWSAVMREKSPTKGRSPSKDPPPKVTMTKTRSSSKDPPPNASTSKASTSRARSPSKDKSPKASTSKAASSKDLPYTPTKKKAPGVRLERLTPEKIDKLTTKKRGRAESHTESHSKSRSERSPKKPCVALERLTPEKIDQLTSPEKANKNDSDGDSVSDYDISGEGPTPVPSSPEAFVASPKIKPKGRRRAGHLAESTKVPMEDDEDEDHDVSEHHPKLSLSLSPVRTPIKVKFYPRRRRRDRSRNAASEMSENADETSENEVEESNVENDLDDVIARVAENKENEDEDDGSDEDEPPGDLKELIRLSDEELWAMNPRMLPLHEMDDQTPSTSKKKNKNRDASGEKKGKRKLFTESAEARELSMLEESDEGEEESKSIKVERSVNGGQLMLSEWMDRPIFDERKDDKNLARIIDWILTEGDFPVPPLQLRFKHHFGGATKEEVKRARRSFPEYTRGRFDRSEDAVLTKRMKQLFAEKVPLKGKPLWRAVRAMLRMRATNSRANSNRECCRMIFAAWVGRPLLGYRRVTHVFARLQSLFVVPKDDADREFDNKLKAKTMQWLEKHGPKYSACRRELDLELLVTTRQLRNMFVAHMEEKRKKTVRGKFGKDDDEEIFYEVMLASRSFDPRAATDRQLKSALHRAAAETRRDPTAVRRRWMATLHPVIAKHLTPGAEADSNAEVKLRLMRLLVSEEGAERYLPPSVVQAKSHAAPQLDYAAIQADHFPLETPSSIREALNTVLLKVKVEGTKTKLDFVERLKKGLEWMQNTPRPKNMTQVKMVEGIIEAYNLAKRRAKTELRRRKDEREQRDRDARSSE